MPNTKKVEQEAAIIQATTKADIKAVDKNLAALLKLQKETIAACKEIGHDKAMLIRLLQRINNALLFNEYALSKFDIILEDLNEHFRRAAARDKDKVEYAVDMHLKLLLKCTALITQILVDSGASDLLSAKEKAYVEKIARRLDAALDTYSYKHKGFYKFITVIHRNLTALAILQQFRLATLAKTTAVATMLSVKQQFNKLIALQVKVKSIKNKYKPARYVALMQRINESIVAGDFVGAGFTKRFNDLFAVAKNHLRSNDRRNAVTRTRRKLN